MVTLTEGKHAGEFIGEMAMGTSYHNDRVTVITGQNLVAGTVVGIITASGKATLHTAGAADGSQNAAAILYDNVNATSADTPGVIVARGPVVVNGNDLTWKTGITANDKAAGIAALLAKGIRVL